MATSKAKRSTVNATKARTQSRLMESFEKTGLLRAVEEVAITLPDGSIVPDKKALIYRDDESYISTVGNRYTVIQNEEVMGRLSSSLVESNLNLKGFKVDHSSSSTTARNLIKITLPEHHIETSKGDSTLLQILARNSYDGSWKQMIDVGGFRMACANGQVWGDAMNAFDNRHTGNFDIAVMAEYLSHAIDVFKEMGAQWLTLQKKKLTKTQAEDAILYYLGKKIVDKDDRQRILTSERSTAVQAMLESWGSYKDELGSNAFALYNTFTQHASHVQDVTSPADAELIRGKQVHKAMSTVM